MKNIHLISTDKPSRLHEFGGTWFSYKEPSKSFRNYKMYITNDEEIKEGDWFIYRCYKVCKCTGLSQSKQILTDNEIAKHKDYGKPQGLSKKIILTTDQDLDGVQSIDDEFLKWFVKNPSCEWVEVGYGWIRLAETDNEGYWVSIPDKQFEMQQEEPKQETLEEAAERYAHNYFNMHETNNYKALKQGYEAGAKEMAERMYSDEEVKEALLQMRKTPMTFVPDKRMYSEEQLFKILLDFVEFPHDHNEGRGSIINRFLKELKKK